MGEVVEEEGVQTERCTVPKTRVDGGRKQKMAQGEREGEKRSYFTPMQHAEEIQLPFELHH